MLFNFQLVTLQADITKLKAESQAALVEAQQELSTTKLAVTAKEEALARQQQEHAQALEKVSNMEITQSHSV